MNNTILKRRTHVSKIIGTDTDKAGLNVEGLKNAARMAGEAICFFRQKRRKQSCYSEKSFLHAQACLQSAMRAGRKSLQKDAPAQRKLCAANSACAEICETSVGALYNMYRGRAKSRIRLTSRHGSNV